jgi:hypothetical protein
MYINKYKIDTNRKVKVEKKKIDFFIKLNKFLLHLTIYILFLSKDK